ncbi:MAG: ribonuclease H-like domain-containing protein [Clostridia bacterium]|nr:ribonuclease H-like domain-containing protein [Clostridia bacterium]
MRNLRERLMAVASSRPSEPREAPTAKREPFFCRERIVPIGELCGIERVTLDEICECDPLFSGGSWDIRRVLFLDTETTGLSGGAGTVAFEIGIGFIDHRGMVIRQYIMRDYSEEGPMLGEIAALFERFDTVVSFNGKSFDLPLLESRMVMNRIRLAVTQMPHLDLLHAARRVYKLRLKRCNLSSLEEAVLGQQRCDDLPGAQVPQRYFDYIRTKEFSLLEDVLRHNFDDVKSLACLTGHLCAVFRQPEMLAHPQDLYGVGRTLMRGGKTHKARACFKILGKTTLSPQAYMHLAVSYKKERQWAQAIETCQSMISQGDGGIWPYIEMAKYYEHIAKDLDRALHYANGALVFALNRAPLWGEDERETSLIRKRIHRIKEKQKKASQSDIQEDKKI